MARVVCTAEHVGGNVCVGVFDWLPCRGFIVLASVIGCCAELRALLMPIFFSCHDILM